MSYIYLHVDTTCLKSIKQAERKKASYENKGYTLVKETATPFSATLTYRKD